ncbi:MAG: DUF5667 domain-containing protein [Anaerolineae bacterium]
MNCSEVALRLATYRDLNAYEQAEVQRHLHGCPSCQAASDVFARQDQLLRSLPAMRLSREFEEKVWAKIHPRRRWIWAWQPMAAVLVVALLIGFVGSSVYASAAAIPGDVLYPIKRLNEQVQLSLTVRDTERARLQEELVERRREEAHQVLSLGRRVRWQFEGVLESAEGTSWVVSGLEVTLCEPTPVPAGVSPGTRVSLEVESVGDRLCLLSVRSVHQPQPTATEDLFPVRPSSPTYSPSPNPPTAPATSTPAATPTGVEPRGRPTERMGPADTPTPEGTRPPRTRPKDAPTPTLTALPTRTPTPLPTAHPGTAVRVPPTLQPTRPPEPTPTPRPDRPRPTHTPAPWATARPQEPTPTPTPEEPRPTPTSTPTRHPTRTPEPWTTARPPTRTPEPWTTARPPIPTPRSDEPTPTPTPLPTKPWPTPTPTSGVWDSPLATPSGRRNGLR